MTVPDFVHDPAFNVGLALAVGMLAQALARHLRVPGIVLLLAAGVLLGPDLLGIVHPESLGDGLQMLVGFAVAVILFEGGMNLNLSRLRREALSIRRLATWGAVVTAIGGALAARLLLGWDWTLSALFGTLVIVTGPTVINPLLRRIRVKPSLATVLEAEGVLVDAIGAIIAVVALEVALSPSGQSLALGSWHLLSRLGFGAILGPPPACCLPFCCAPSTGCRKVSRTSSPCPSPWRSSSSPTACWRRAASSPSLPPAWPSVTSRPAP